MSSQCFDSSTDKVDPVTSTPAAIALHLYNGLYSGPSGSQCDAGKQWANAEDSINFFSHLPAERAKAVNKAYEEITGSSFLLDTQANPILASVQREEVARALGLPDQAAIVKELDAEQSEWVREHSR